MAVPSSLPSVSNAFPATLIRPRGTSLRFCTVPLMCKWPSAQTYIPGSMPGWRPTLSTFTLTLSFISAARAGVSPPRIAIAVTSLVTVLLFIIVLLPRWWPRLLDDAVGAKQDRLEDLQAESLRRLEVNDQLDAVRELHGDLPGRRARQDLVGQACCLAPLTILVGTI